MTELEINSKKIKEVLDAGFQKAFDAAQKPFKDWMSPPKFPTDELAIQIIGGYIRSLEEEVASLKNQIPAQKKK